MSSCSRRLFWEPWSLDEEGEAWRGLPTDSSNSNGAVTACLHTTPYTLYVRELPTLKALMPFPAGRSVVI